MILVTGGAGFIGSNFISNWFEQSDELIVNLDKLTYAGNPNSLLALKDDPRHVFVHGDIGDRNLVAETLRQHQPRAVINFAAESHVDRSILGPGEFIKTNVTGTFALLEMVHGFWSQLGETDKMRFRFLHVSTDEVFGTLDPDDPPFRESTAYAPNSPYAASKAASDHLVRAYHHTYGLPVLTTHCSNNYGPYQFPEKLIPLVICNALAGESLPIYGDGQQVRDWLYVSDHCSAIRRVLDGGRLGHTYNIGGRNEVTNLNVVHTLLSILDDVAPKEKGSYRDQIRFVADRPGHDRRYAIDALKMQRELGWAPQETFETGIRKTVMWYLANMDWVNDVKSGSHSKWIEQNYGQRNQL